MDADRFDDVLRSVAAHASRRRAVLGLVSAALGLRPAHEPWLASARRRKKQKKKKKKQRPPFNEFDCLNVGARCRGNDRLCCSRICHGKKPKKGKRDKRKCVGHDETTCLAGQQQAFCGGSSVTCTTSAGFSGLCDTTTGNAGYCHFDADCMVCRTDADCQPFCGPRAACLRCPGGCDAAGGTVCAGPGECTFPT